MRLCELKIRNYRTLASIDIPLPSSYAAICGANDSGKTNVIRAIRTLVRGEGRRPFIFPPEDEDLSIKDEFPKWKDTEPQQREISFEVTIELNKTRDIGFHQFVTKQLSLPAPDEALRLCIAVTYRPEKPEPAVVVTARDQQYTDLNAQEVLKKLQSSRTIIFHNSTEIEARYVYPGRSVAGHIREITGQHEPLVASMKKTVNRGLARISKSQQAEFESLLGRLRTKYKVGLSMPSFDFSYLPFSITLGDRKVEVPLDDWGSGTKNRTLVLLALFRARQIGMSEASAAKITPVIIVEEPESFLHPSAQAEFGQVLQDLAEEFQVQVIVTTHSPYLLNLRDPSSNILLRRRTVYRQLRETERVQTDGDNWMAPFAHALGLGADEFKPWKQMLMGHTDAVLLVEGETDKEYFEMLRKPEHGNNRLRFQGEIVSYEGTGALSNTVLLRFVKNRYPKFFVTFDLDAAERIEKQLKALELEKGKHYLPVGSNAAGKRNIEGLLPNSVMTAVYGRNADLVQAATSGTREEQKSAKARLKKLLLDEFKKRAQPGDQYFGKFYSLVKTINKAIA
ncbi:MAG: ATP-binding protein [Deltaproteobacteria bacterium]|nr:ATP-binding protein [Deltaproteobacteria bacterium]